MDKNYLLYLSGVISENKYFEEPNINQYDQSEEGQPSVVAINNSLSALMAVKPFIKQDADTFVAVMKAIDALQGFLGNSSPHLAGKSLISPGQRSV